MASSGHLIFRIIPEIFIYKLLFLNFSLALNRPKILRIIGWGETIEVWYLHIVEKCVFVTMANVL